MPNERPTQSCEVCGAQAAELRRNRCWGCYSRWVESRPVGIGASCCLCADRRRASLKMLELLRAWVPICHTCAARASQLSPMPQHLEEIRARLVRERRDAERRAGEPDGRVLPRERRGLDRRQVSAAELDEVLLLDESDIVLADLEEDISPSEVTRILERPL